MKVKNIKVFILNDGKTFEVVTTTEKLKLFLKESVEYKDFCEPTPYPDLLLNGIKFYFKKGLAFQSGHKFEIVVDHIKNRVGLKEIKIPRFKTNTKYSFSETDSKKIINCFLNYSVETELLSKNGE